MPDRSDFTFELGRIIDRAERDGVPYVEVKAGDLHRLVGGYPGHDHRMPVACSVMRQRMKEGDSMVSSPPQGDGASLTIRYKFPR